MKALAMLLFLSLVLACNKDPREDPSAIEAKDVVGRWKIKNGQLVMEFRDSGLYCVPQSFTGCNETAMQMNDQRWGVQDGKLVWKDMENVLSAAKRVAMVVKYTGSEMTLKLENGNQIVFVRQ